MDFAIGLLLFTFTLVVYFSYTNNFQKEDRGGLDILVKDAKSISSSLALSGYPTDWDNTTVIRIGISDEQKINVTKVASFKQLAYNFTKKIFATSYDYFVFFTDSHGDVLNINGICGIGNPIISTTYNAKVAYYYQDDANSFLKDFMNNTFHADIYKNDIFGLASRLSGYNFIVMEQPLIADGDFKNVDNALNNYSSRGGLFMISGELETRNGKKLVGAIFNKKSGQSSSQRTAIVNNTDQYLSLSVGQSMVFSQYYYIVNDTSSALPAADLKTIATYNQTDDKAIAKWNYGNGTVYFFSDFNVTFFNGDFVKIVEDSARALVSGTCTPINVSNINAIKIVKAERYLNYNSDVVKMSLYVWQ